MARLTLRPKPEEPRTAVTGLTIDSDLAEVNKVRLFVKDALAGLPLADKDLFRIDLSLVEVCINIVLYAYPREKGQIVLHSWRQGPRLYFEVRDSGVPFDPRSMKSPDLREILRTARKGGFGIFLSRTMMDGFEYRREDGQNILTLYKKLRLKRPSKNQ
jgi:sigma-B regulation protein RsbU (phosphoserine phosphatase)